MKKGMILFPPEWLPINPYASMPMLAGQLHHAGFEVTCRDVNLEFFDHILNGDYLNGVLGEIRERLTPREYSLFRAAAEHTDDAVITLKTGRGFYDIDTYQAAMDTVDAALRLVSAKYSGQKISLYDFTDSRFKWEFSSLRDICTNKLPNMFYDFFMTQIEQWQKADIDYVCVTMPCYTQLVPAFTLTYLLKKYTGITVCVGGNIITRLAPGIRSNHEMLGEFCDYIMMGDGERAIVRFAELMEGACGVVDVPGLMWREGHQTFANPVDTGNNMGTIARSYFKGMDLSGYYCPEITIAIEFARGCYWGKCSFCAVDVSAKKYCMRPMENLLDEVEYLIREHGIRNFVFVDEAIPVKKYLEFAEGVLARGLDISFYSFARMEKAYTLEALKLLKKAGLAILWWGYESKSARIMKLMNKGVEVDERITILRNAYDAGVWNHCLCMAGFPTETEEEIQETFAEIRNNRELFNSSAMNAFFLSYNSPMYNEPEKYGITSVGVPYMFDGHCHFKMTDYTEEEYIRMVDDFRREYMEENRDRLWAMEYNNFDHLLMYLKHYGCEKVRSYDRGKNRVF